MDVDFEEVIKDEEWESDNSDEKALELEVINLEKKIAENKFAYQPYIDLINALKSLVDLDRLRNARERMAKQFPLSPDLWIDWLRDEIYVATSPEEKNKILQLFEAAVKDYLSVDLWVLYITFVICYEKEQDSSETGNVRKICESALTAAGLHVIKGSILWDTYIEYEKTVLSTLADKPEEYHNQLKYIGNLYKRQLSCPLWDIEETYEKFQKWLAEFGGDNPEKIIDKKIVDNIYKKTREKLDKIKPFEEALLSDSENQIEIYKRYLEHEKSKEGSPVRVQNLYERILCDSCLNEEIWMEYLEYLSTVLCNADVVLNACKRAVRNCPWCVRLYEFYIRCLEKYEKPKKIITGENLAAKTRNPFLSVPICKKASCEHILSTIAKVLEDAFGSGLQTESDFRIIWMTYLEYLRRHFDSPNISKEEEEKRLEDLRTVFAKAVEFLNQLPNADPECVVAQFWARIEANYCKNMEKSRELWNDILSYEGNKTAEMWLEYIHLESTFGDSKHIRKLFPRALQGTKDWPEKIAKAWLNYERDEGTLESFENCLNKIEARIKQVEKIREKEAEAAELENATNNFGRKSKKGLAHPKDRQKMYPNYEDEPKKVTGYKRKQANVDEANSPTKKAKLNEREEEMDIAKPSNDDLVKKLLEENKSSHGETVIHDSSKDNRTVFVSNLDFSTEESTLRDIFSSCGTITDLRLVRDYKGRSKGYCYVEFERTKEAQLALKKDRELIDRRPMFVSKCDPDKETRGSGFKYSSSLEKNKLFVRGLPFTVTEEELRTLFSQYGALRDVRLVTYRNGHSKGLAYVEFEDETSAAQAILKTDGITIQEKVISVAISNPPGRKMETSKLIPSLGGGPKEFGPRGKGRTQISFLPRSLQKIKPTTPSESLASLSIESPAPAEEKKALNNSDFRKFLV